jgi:uncharacterized protein YkwD
MPLLRIDVAGQRFQTELPAAVVRIGRDVECDLRIEDPAVGAVHASIEPLADGGHLLKDLNTGRPTRVNGLGVKRVVLNPGDVIEIGPARLTYLDGSVPASVPAPVPAARAAPRAAERAPAAPGPVRPAPPAAAPLPAYVPARAAPVPVAQVPGAPAPAAAPPSPAAPAARAARAPAPSSSGKKLGGALVALALFAGLAVLAAQFLGRGGDSTERLSRLKSDLDHAKVLAWEEGDLPAALSLLDRLAHAEVEGIRVEAKREREAWDRRIAAGDRDFRSLVTRAHRLDGPAARAAVESLAVKHGPGIAKRHGKVLDEIASARAAWVASGAGKTSDAADAAVAEGRFAVAIAAWDEFERGAPAVDDTRRAIEAGRAAVAEAAERAFSALREEAAARAKRDGPAAAATMLRDRLDDFAGTAHRAALVAEAVGYDRAAGGTSPEAPGEATARAPTGRDPEPTTPERAPAPAPPPPPEIEAWKEASARVEAARIARKIPEALAAAEEAVRAAGRSHHGVAAANEVYDLSLARDGMVVLGDAIREHPGRFAEIELAPKFVASLVDADLEHVTIAVRGGQAKHRWSAIEPARLAKIMEAAQVPPKKSVPLAQWLASLGARDAAERLLARHVEAGGDRDVAFERVARWRGETVPRGGYVLFEGRFVTEPERERLLLAAKIAAAAAKVGSKDAAVRRAAYDELGALGAPAKPAFARALLQRRTAAVEEMAGLKVWTSGRTRARLQQELEKRRAAAIALIENEQAYPYPSATHAGQEEVDRLVGLVRQVWSQPFDLVAAWDEKIAEALGLVTEVDEVLAKVEEGYAPDLEALRARVNRAIDVPGIAPDEYSRKVLAFNERVKTTAGREERDNVRAVNEYRMMMGRHALKIEERLVRAARGHSIEMREKGYFAHESPTPERSSPGKRTARQGYSAGVGENIARGTLTGRDAFDAWFHSSGHHRNMLSRGWTEMGAGRSGGSWWTQNFGAMTGKNLGEPSPLGEPEKDVAPEPDDFEAPAAPGGPDVPDEAPPTAPPVPDPPPDAPPPDGPGPGPAPGMR